MQQYINETSGKVQEDRSHLKEGCSSGWHVRSPLDCQDDATSTSDCDYGKTAQKHGIKRHAAFGSARLQALHCDNLTSLG